MIQQESNKSNANYQRFIKKYRNITICRNKFVKKSLSYANPTSLRKLINIKIIPDNQIKVDDII